mmetsp:Transcript_30292/g.51830  ORF Transcript_30292/g.51830 Transcript_30292/m.51830 type:complete len:151 (+) Transcript_30292:145-597(+)
MVPSSPTQPIDPSSMQGTNDGEFIPTQQIQDSISAKSQLFSLGVPVKSMTNSCTVDISYGSRVESVEGARHVFTIFFGGSFVGVVVVFWKRLSPFVVLCSLSRFSVVDRPLTMDGRRSMVSDADNLIVSLQVQRVLVLENMSVILCQVGV